MLILENVTEVVGILRKLVVVFLMLSFTLSGAAWAAGKAEAAGQATVMVKEPANSRGLVEPALSMEMALEKAREMFPELLGKQDVKVELEDNPRWRSWRIEWDLSADGSPIVNRCSVMLDAETGELTHMYYHMDTPSTNGSTPVTREEAQKIAVEFIKKYRPAELTRVRLVEQPGYYQPGTLRGTYQFNFQRVENGIPVSDDSISTEVEVLNGRVKTFLINWHKNVVFPEPKSVPEGMEEQVLEKTGLFLNYQIAPNTGRDDAGVPEATLLYQLNAPDFLMIDPVSGDTVNMQGKRMPIKQYRLFEKLPAVTKGDGAAVRLPAEKISPVAAQKVAQDFFNKLGIKGEVTHSGGGSGSDGVFFDEVWSYSLRDEQQWRPGQIQRHRSVGINTLTGEVKSYYYHSEQYENAEKKALSRDEAREKALEFIKLVSPEKLSRVIEQNDQDFGYYFDPMSYRFNFMRLVNGLPFTRDGIRVTVTEDGTIVDYNCDWHAVKFPETSAVISLDEAKKIFQEKMKLSQVYFFPWKEGEPWPGNRPELALTFNGRWGKALDAFTGEPVFLGWGSVQPEEKEETGISQEHWAAAPLTILARSGMLPAQGFNPDSPLTRRDAVRVLMGAIRDYYSQGETQKSPFSDISIGDRDYQSILAAVKIGILEPGGQFSPGQPLTREELAAWLVGAMCFKEVAAMPVKIELTITDAQAVSEQYRNYVAIAVGLGLMQGDESGLFRPAAHVTWAEMASLTTRTAPRLRAVMRQY